MPHTSNRPIPMALARLLHDWRTGAAVPPPCSGCAAYAATVCTDCLQTLCRNTDCRDPHVLAHDDYTNQIPIARP